MFYIPAFQVICCFSVAKLCLTLRPHELQHATPGFPVLRYLLSLLKLMCIELIVPSNHLILCCPFSSCLQSFPASGSFLISQFFASGGHNIGASTNNEVLILSCFLPKISIMAKLIFLSFWCLTDRCAEYYLPS